MKKGLKGKHEPRLQMLRLEGTEECSEQGDVPIAQARSRITPTGICCEDISGMTAESL